jgi:hypothetical protein
MPSTRRFTPFGVPDAWNDPFKLKTPVDLNLFAPLLEIVPDAVSAADAPARR